VTVSDCESFGARLWRRCVLVTNNVSKVSCAAVLALLVLTPARAFAHCDGLYATS
jgi:hypothetical protein